MTDPEVFTPGQRLEHESLPWKVRFVGVLPEPFLDDLDGPLDVALQCPDGTIMRANSSRLTPIPDTVEITVSLTREQVEYLAPLRFGGSDNWTPLVDACRSWLASEGEAGVSS